jgi:hypothetical protein
MPFLLTAEASGILVLFMILILLLLLLHHVFIFVLFRLVLRELAPRSISAGLTTAPPHLPSVLRLLVDY